MRRFFVFMGVFILYIWDMMVIDNEFDFGEIVYLKTDKEQCARIVVSISAYKAGELLYKVVCGTLESSHYGFELSREVNVLISTTN